NKEIEGTRETIRIICPIINLWLNSGDLDLTEHYTKLTRAAPWLISIKLRPIEINELEEWINFSRDLGDRPLRVDQLTLIATVIDVRYQRERYSYWGIPQV